MMKSIPVIPTVMTLIMIPILCALGFWQLERLEWKLSLIDSVEMRYALDPIALPLQTDDLEELEYRHVQFAAKLQLNKILPHYKVGLSGRPGYDLYVMGVGERAMMVNLGWVDERDYDTVKQQVETLQSVEGNYVALLRRSGQQSLAGIENDLVKNMWFYADLQGMADYLDQTDIYPLYLYLDDNILNDPRLKTAQTRLSFINNHLDYALTWFGLAITLLVIFIIFVVKYNKRRAE